MSDEVETHFLTVADLAAAMCQNSRGMTVDEREAYRRAFRKLWKPYVDPRISALESEVSRLREVVESIVARTSLRPDVVELVGEYDAALGALEAIRFLALRALESDQSGPEMEPK